MGLLKVSIYSVYSGDIIYTMVIAAATQVDLGRQYRVRVQAACYEYVRII
jgi:hypothetical protein